MSKVLVGRDATAYLITGGGGDFISSGFSQTTQYDMLGVWKDIEIEVEREWKEVQSSSAELKEKRRTTIDWKGTLSNNLRLGGINPAQFALANDYVQVNFTEADTGRAMTAVGGIVRGSARHGADEATGSLEITNVGLFNGGSSLFYV